MRAIGKGATERFVPLVLEALRDFLDTSSFRANARLPVGTSLIPAWPGNRDTGQVRLEARATQLRAAEPVLKAAVG
ncbi:hypothetical protein BZM26_09185 [Paraburkholderia strydomiana]|nr:hypothetical protein BZM26_09185 [Paraburkholderia strydomiana]